MHSRKMGLQRARQVDFRLGAAQATATPLIEPLFTQRLLLRALRPHLHSPQPSAWDEA